MQTNSPTVTGFPQIAGKSFVSVWKKGSPWCSWARVHHAYTKKLQDSQLVFANAEEVISCLSAEQHGHKVSRTLWQRSQTGEVWGGGCIRRPRSREFLNHLADFTAARYIELEQDKRGLQKHGKRNGIDFAVAHFGVLSNALSQAERWASASVLQQSFLIKLQPTLANSTTGTRTAGSGQGPTADLQL